MALKTCTANKAESHLQIHVGIYQLFWILSKIVSLENSCHDNQEKCSFYPSKSNLSRNVDPLFSMPLRTKKQKEKRKEACIRRLVLMSLINGNNVPPNKSVGNICVSNTRHKQWTAVFYKYHRFYELNWSISVWLRRDSRKTVFGFLINVFWKLYLRI